MKILLQIRFIMLFLQLILTGLIYVTKFENIGKFGILKSNRTLPASQINAYLLVSSIMLGIQILLSIFGLTFVRGMLLLQIWLQTLGVFTYALYILMRLPYPVIAQIWGLFCLIPFCLDLITIIVQSLEYQKYTHLHSQ